MLDKMNEQILNKMNGQDLLEFLRQRKDNRWDQISSRKIIHCLSSWNIVTKRETLSNTEFIKFV